MQLHHQQELSVLTRWSGCMCFYFLEFS
jgi:hypothetical protein